MDKFHEELRAKLLGAAIPPADLRLATAKPAANPVAMERLARAAWKETKDNQRIIEWMVRREGFYFDGPGSDWPFLTITYAACRDYLVWKHNKPECVINDELAKMNSKPEELE